MNEVRCKLCNKPYNHHYALFGRGCLENIYDFLEISKPSRFIYNKEMYLCNRIAWRNFKFFLSKKKKYILAEKYIALKYLDKINFDFFNDLREKIYQDIKGISVFSKNIVEKVPFKLNAVYELYNDIQKFEELINKLKDINLETLDEKIADETFKKISFIFDETKKTNQITYVGFYAMQFMFWQIVVAGGLLANMKLSSKLLLNSLVPIGKEPNDLIIDDEKTIEQIIESEEFKEKIRQLTEKYCKDNNKFSGNSLNNEDCKMRFKDKDLFLAIHRATMTVDIEKSKIKGWNINMEITDTYDFTDFKNLKEYATSNASMPMSIFSTILNNFGVVSSEYGVIKPYKVTIKIQKDNYVVE